jgi:hypothetical protein
MSDAQKGQEEVAEKTWHPTCRKKQQSKDQNASENKPHNRVKNHTTE